MNHFERIICHHHFLHVTEDGLVGCSILQYGKATNPCL